MNQKNKIEGIALFCDLNGKIVAVLRDDIGLSKINPLGRLFVSIIDSYSRNNGLNFILEIKDKNVAYDYRFALKINESNFDMYFMGVLVQKQILIIGADNHKEAIEFTNLLQEINNEQSNLIRDLVQEKYAANEQQVENQQLFDEITKLNNELVNLQRDLTVKNRELERLNELKNQFLGMAVHDMRNPLNVIASYAEFIIDEAKDKLSKEHIDFLQTIEKSAGFMFSLIEDLLDISKIQSGKLQLMKEDIDMIEFALENIFRNNMIAQKKNIKINFISEIETLNIFIDRQKMEQVFNNLIGNAIKFSHPDSEIHVKIDKTKDDIVLEFRDFGTGIAPENFDKIFVPFQKIANKGTQGEKGTGLGLTIVKKIIEGHHGNIWFESEIENQPEGNTGGTAFFISIPLNNEL